MSLGKSKDGAALERVKHRELGNATRLNENDIMRKHQDKNFLENEIYRCRSEITAMEDALHMKTTIVER